MTVYLVRRLIQALFVVLAMSLIVFVGVYAIGDPVEILISPDADQIERERAVAALGLDQPLWEQYLRVPGQCAAGRPRPVLRVQRTGAEADPAAHAGDAGTGLRRRCSCRSSSACRSGLYAGLRPNAPVSKAIMAGSILGFSLPTFWVGLMLIMVFAVQLGWLPSTGRGETCSVTASSASRRAARACNGPS